MKEVEFWLNNPLILLKKEYIDELFPNKEYCMERKMNALTRVVILLTILGYLLTKSQKLLISSILTIIIIIILYYSQRNKEKKVKVKNIKELLNSQEGFTNPRLYELTKEGFTKPSNNNPLMNVGMTEYKENPNRKEAAPAYNVAVEKEINENVKKNLDPRLFKDLGDDLYFEQSMRQFYSTPNTTIPNNQKEFAEFCYGGMLSSKEGDIY
jgi:hypothetical protein